MIGTLSQLVTLSSAANGILAGRFDPDTFYPEHADFKFCNSVRFVDIGKGRLGKSREVERHKDPNEWLRSLADANASRVWLTFAATDQPDAPDHMLAGFVGGGGDWQMVVATQTKTEFWMSRWKVTREYASDNRIWGVTYGCVATSEQAVNVPDPDLSTAASRLLSALNAIQEFATQHDLPFWAERFQRAIECFDSANPVSFPEYIQFVCLDSYPETARRLFAAAYNGWVFGGMGSWNDMYFESDSENHRYNELSAELYSAINDSIQQATWSFGAGNPP